MRGNLIEIARLAEEIRQEAKRLLEDSIDPGSHAAEIVVQMVGNLTASLENLRRVPSAPRTTSGRIEADEIAALRLVIDNVATALCPDSPIESARAEFDVDGLGACQIISRLYRELAEARKDTKRLDWFFDPMGCSAQQLEDILTNTCDGIEGRAAIDRFRASPPKER